MTENRTTEKLCKLLEERGIKWSHGDAAYETEWSTPDGRHCSAMYWKPTFTVLISGCTPEQAIAATLGSEREKQLELLVKQLWYLVNHRSGYGYAAALESIEELGIEVIDE